MDTHVPAIREVIGVRHVRLLATCAKNIMVHLLTVKEAHEKRRAIKMQMCIADFINPRSRFHRQARRRVSSERHRLVSNRGHSPSSKIITDADGPDLSATMSIIDSAEEGARRESRDDIRKDSKRGRRRSSSCSRETTMSDRSSDSPFPEKLTDADHQKVFDRAVELIRQSLDLELGGGVVFLDTSSSKEVDFEHGTEHQRKPNYSVEPDSVRRIFEGCTRNVADEQLSKYSPVTTRPSSTKRASSNNLLKEKVVLAAASLVSPGNHPITYGRADSTYKINISPPELLSLCRKYPRGKLYNVPEHTPSVLHDAYGHSISGALSTKFWYLTLLRRQFPDAKQVIFLPMFYANLNRWTAIFAYTSSPYRVFAYEEYLHMLSFCNAIRAEIVELAAVFADKQKSDFIGSVSHELRSPLHGIIAALELLQDTECTSFQESCLETAEACAHTLMDTIAMVLDYSKVVHSHSLSEISPTYSSNETSSASPPTSGCFEEKILVHSRPDRLRTTRVPSNSMVPFDLALVTEEVVDGLATGHLSRARTNIGFDDYEETNRTLYDLSVRPGLRRVLAATRAEVELILDIQALPDWRFISQPGAYRRIILNLFGNSLKYTKHGYIIVSLGLAEERHPSPGSDEQISFVKLVIQDTGQGISPEYLRNRIFTPFSQENIKAAGTGLGLSIVRALVDMLNGEIDIKSILNTGTIVTVTFPMKKFHHTRDSGMPSSGFKDSNVLALQSMPRRPQVVIYEPALEHDSFEQAQAVKLVHRAIIQYLSGWFQIPTLQTWDFNALAQILIIDEVHLPALLAQRPDYLDTVSRQSVIILCANNLRQSVLARDIQCAQVELVRKPIGPYKLARTLCRALEKAIKADTRTETVQVPATSVNTSPSCGLSVVTQRGKIFSDASHDMNKTGSIFQSHIHTNLLDHSLVNASTHVMAERLTLPNPVVKEVKPSPDGGFPFLDTAQAEASKSSQATQAIFCASGMPDESVFEECSKAKCNPQKRPGDRPSPRSLLRAKTVAIEATLRKPVELTSSSTVPTSAAGAYTMVVAPPNPNSRMPRLLLVDDNKVNLNLLHTFVKRKGFTSGLVSLAEDGQQAVDSYRSSAAQGTPPDIIFMDISMPIMNGYEATRTIRKLERVQSHSNGILEAVEQNRAFIVALTGNGGGDDQAEAFESGVDIYMTKPMSMKEVGKILDHWQE
ncbi:MAG: hypothetical protein FE78DRAFT_497147 [Acidomyces sp. 'richmondensis']|nr:MAG: hypothetical protein FE78DRAFT_497147 [Acidomyces sp. 'richmondensis']